MNLRKNIIGINTSFESLQYDGFEETDFSSSVSLLDYDAVVIDTSFIIMNYKESSSSPYQNYRLLNEYDSNQIIEDYNRIREQIVEMLRRGKNIYVLMGNNEGCYIYTGEKQFDGTGKNARRTNIVREFDTYSFLPIDIKATHVYGERIASCCHSPYSEFFRKTGKCSHYAAYYSVAGQPNVLAKIYESEKIVSSVSEYENGKIILLPHPYYEDDYTDSNYWHEYGKLYLDSLFELNDALRLPDDAFALPQWTDQLTILDEDISIKNREEIKREIKKLEKQLESQNNYISELQKHKGLITLSGTPLETIVQETLSDIGFSLLAAERGRSDLIAKYEDIYIVAEIKGVSKSAAEKHAAQLEKWASQFIEERDCVPKPILIVNGFCDLPLWDRTESVFPNQMVKYSTSRNHVLLSTQQLLCLWIDIKSNPTARNSLVAELLSTIGVYCHYENVYEYIRLLPPQGA